MTWSNFITPETIISVTVSVTFCLIGHRLIVATIIRKAGEALTHCGDYVASLDPKDIKDAMVDAKDSVDLVKQLQAKTV